MRRGAARFVSKPFTGLYLEGERTFGSPVERSDAMSVCKEGPVEIYAQQPEGVLARIVSQHAEYSPPEPPHGVRVRPIPIRVGPDLRVPGPQRVPCDAEDREGDVAHPQVRVRLRAVREQACARHQVAAEPSGERRRALQLEQRLVLDVRLCKVCDEHGLNPRDGGLPEKDNPALRRRGRDVVDLRAPADRAEVPHEAERVVDALPERVRLGGGGLVPVPPFHGVVEPEKEGDREEDYGEGGAPAIGPE